MQTQARYLFFAVSILFAIQLPAQSKKIISRVDTLRTAGVDVYVVNAREEPRKGEMVVFIATKRKKQHMGRTDKHGLLRITLPAGDDYKVTVKTFSDTGSFGTLSIPPLGEGEFFESDFRVEIVYEPAKHFTLDNVEFDVGKATLRPASYKELDELVEYLRWKETEKIEISGHTDNAGKDADNLKLSQQRADAVRNYLLKKGVKAGRVVAKGYGASEPVADNATAQGRQKNRRTEVRLTDQ